eukprot:TRINITY_DN19493_c0_g1_i1.p1 TRINITY_DN19493_c0_g1~~TRINITY_DN19493_c0_g1_i1.p1  ORF type:complete len:556 (+),score=52.67 TRINITY_DN19493_c0_g1_i1:48-1715(+)
MGCQSIKVLGWDVLQWAVVFGLYGAYLSWQVLLGEEIDSSKEIHSQEENNFRAAALYYWLGGWAWAFVMAAVSFAALAFADRISPLEKAALESDITGAVHIIACTVTTYFMLIGMAHAEPFGTTMRHFALNKKALEGTAAIAGCSAADPTGKLAVNDVTFLQLTEPGWTVDMEGMVRTKKDADEWLYAAVPIVYRGGMATGNGTNGAVGTNGTRCFFDPPIYAACASPVAKPTMKDCGWKWKGSYPPYAVALRRTSVSPWWADAERTKFRKSVDGSRLFDFDGPTALAVEEEAAAVQSLLWRVHGRMIRAALIFSTVYFVLFFGVCVYRGRYSTGGSSEGEAAALSQETDSERSPTNTLEVTVSPPEGNRENGRWEPNQIRETLDHSVERPDVTQRLTPASRALTPNEASLAPLGGSYSRLLRAKTRSVTPNRSTGQLLNRTQSNLLVGAPSGQEAVERGRGFTDDHNAAMHQSLPSHPAPPATVRTTLAAQPVADCNPLGPSSYEAVGAPAPLDPDWRLPWDASTVGAAAPLDPDWRLPWNASARHNPAMDTSL